MPNNNLVSYIANYNSQHNRHMIRVHLNSDFNSLKIILATRRDNMKVASWYKRLNKVNNYDNFQQVMIDRIKEKVNKLD